MKKLDKKELTFGAANLSCADLVGRDILIIGYVGARGTEILADKNKEVILARFAPVIYNGAISGAYKTDVSKALKICKDNNALCFLTSGTGGIEGALFDIGNTFSVGMDIGLKQIPITQHTVEICNLLDVNPYKLYSDCVVVITDRGNSLVKTLKAEGISAKVCGRVTKGLDKVIINGEERSFITPSRGKDELYKYIPKGEIL